MSASFFVKNKHGLQASLLALGLSVSLGSSSSWAKQSVIAANEFYMAPANLEQHYDPNTITLPNGKVLLVDVQLNAGSLKTHSELYDPDTNQFIPTRGIKAQYTKTPKLALLDSGLVLVSGWQPLQNNLVEANTELYDPATNSFSRFTSSALLPEYTFLKVLKNTSDPAKKGQLFLMDGSLGQMALYNPKTDISTAINATHTYNRESNGSTTVTELLDGRLLIAGGGQCHPTTPPCLWYDFISNAEIYDPITDRISPTGNMLSDESLATTTLLPDGRVLFVGGIGEQAEIYDPISGTFSLASRMVDAPSHYASSAIWLPHMKQVLIVGGSTYLGYNTTAELYDPLTNIFSSTGSMTYGRMIPSMALIPGATDRVLVIGGREDNNTSDNAEIYVETANRVPPTESF